ncbi:hypothetical protein AVDCRST_MAG94-4748 [uncultured Leptolyngbya sp.]|uniref:Uncharacterized protein n=1 Tax=uncultured Leptolyngbya sp. TaxID=332963 RepID=A0A6J4NCG2_9CYAN|nr:hypothetical protein AVDCRST_MAG94-4748 [uncultured Leptolyngbya sp.]
MEALRQLKLGHRFQSGSKACSEAFDFLILSKCDGKHL